MGGIKSYIHSHEGTPLLIDNNGLINTVQQSHPVVDNAVFVKPFRQYFTDDGTSSGSSDMRVNGSSIEQEFYIEAVDDKDIFIKTLSFEIADAGATLNDFGNLSALSNGIEFCWTTQSEGTVLIHEGLKTNWDVVRLSGGNPSFGDGTAAFRANNVSGSAEGYIPVLNVSEVFGLPWGFQLRKGTKDKLLFKVRDNLSSGMDTVDVIGYGIQL